MIGGDQYGYTSCFLVMMYVPILSTDTLTHHVQALFMDVFRPKSITRRSSNTSQKDGVGNLAKLFEVLRTLEDIGLHNGWERYSILCLSRPCPPYHHIVVSLAFDS